MRNPKLTFILHDLQSHAENPRHDRIERQRRDKTHSWGCFLITYKVQEPPKNAASSSKGAPKAKYSRQATCNMPERNPKNAAGKVSKCTKTMGFDPSEANAEQVCLWRIRHWCNCCTMFATKQEHQEFHPAADDLPEESAIVACKMDGFLPPALPALAAPAQPSQPTRKRKRPASKSNDTSSSSSSSSSDSSTNSYTQLPGVILALMSVVWAQVFLA